MSFNFTANPRSVRHDGSAVATIDPLGQTTVRVSDGLGWEVAVIDPLGQVTRTTYDAVVVADGVALVETARTDPLARTVRVRADGAGLARQQVDALVLCPGADV